MKSLHYLFLVITLSFITNLSIAQTQQDSMTTFILVRHAEKVIDGTANPTLTKEGLIRSIQLAYMLRDHSIAAVFSTDYERTLKTAEPTANFHELPVKRYLASNQDFFIDNVMEQYRGKTVLIVGHSNTIPSILNILTGGNYWKIKEYIYNDFFVVNAVRKGEGKLLHLKYGAMSEPPVPYNIDANNIGVQGYDVVSYFLERKAVKGNMYISTTYQGVTYYFSSQKHLTLFTKNPEQYIPQYGGWCAYGMSMLETNGKVGKYSIDPKSFKIVKGKLYLFYDDKDYDGLEFWNENSDTENIKRANVTWKILKNK